MRFPSILLAGAAMVLLSGCSQLGTEYGESKGVSGRTSLNGFGALRSAFEQAGFRSRDVSRLSDRVRQTDVIVWTPKGLAAVDDRVTRWFDRWLRQGGRTLVYIIPDSGSEADYWIDAAKFAPPDQRLEYRKRAARSINQRIQWRLNRAKVQSNGWFQVESLRDRRLVQKLEGPWQDDLQRANQADDRRDAEFAATEYLVVPCDSQDASGTASPSGATAVALNNGPTGPSTPLWNSNGTVTKTNTPVEFVPLLSMDADSSLVGEVHSSEWRDSKIVVVAGGSLLTNYAFSRDANRRLADKIVLESKPAANSDLLAGFLTSDGGTVLVSEREPGAPQITGMEMLSEWPISIVTMHGLVLGMVVCLMLLPIFGRPKKIRRTEANDFGHHLDAVAALMQRAGGEHYARSRISDYMKRMHGETSGPWVLPDRDSSAGSGAVPTPPGKRLPSKEAASQSATPEPGQSDQVGESESNRFQNQDEENR